MGSDGAPAAILTLMGTPYERGLAHGEELRDRIAVGTGAWLEEIGTTVGGGDPHTILRACVEQTTYLGTCCRLTPDAVDETRGIATGAGLPFATVFAYNLGDERPWGGGCESRAACTAVGIVGDRGRPTIVGQTNDLEPSYDGTQVVLRIVGSDGRVLLASTTAGVLALCGVNDRGVVACCNALELEGSADGLPVTYLVRLLLDCEDRHAAENCLRSVVHAAGQNYTIGDSGGVAYFECSGGHVWASEVGAARLGHTNHPLVAPAAAADPRDSVERMAALQARLPAVVDLDDVTALFESAPICVTEDATENQPTFTFSAMIAELGRNPVLHYAPGRPDATDWIRIAL